MSADVRVTGSDWGSLNYRTVCCVSHRPALSRLHYVLVDGQSFALWHFLLIINSRSLSVLRALSKHLQCLDPRWHREVKCQQQLETSGKSIPRLRVCLCGDSWGQSQNFQRNPAHLEEQRSVKPAQPAAEQQLFKDQCFVPQEESALLFAHRQHHHCRDTNSSSD